MILVTGSLAFDLDNLISEDRIASIVAAGHSIPGPLNFRERDEDIKILTSKAFSNDANTRYPHTAFILRGRG